MYFSVPAVGHKTSNAINCWEEYGSVSLEENRVTMEEIIDDTCEQLHDICLCQSTARSWNLDGWFIDKYYDKIKFTFFDEMWEYYEVNNEFPSLNN